MNTDKLTLPPRGLPPRVSYHNGMLLDADDFSEEQKYHRERLADVLARLHGSGTVAGLKVERIAKGAPMPDGGIADEELIVVHPGLAVDRLGRLLDVPRRRYLGVDKCFTSVATAAAAV